jgi:hypothetical protein
MSPWARIAGPARCPRKIDRVVVSRISLRASGLLLLRHHARQNGLFTSRHRSADERPISRNSISFIVARNARSLLLASHSSSSAAHRFSDADANARPLFTFVFTQAAVFAVQSRSTAFRCSDAARRAMSADVMILAPVLCEYRSVGSVDRTVPHHICRDTPLIAVDFEYLSLSEPNAGFAHASSLRTPAIAGQFALPG